ncbi:uncharacterized protein [Typha angustifolia]|uniref:uncharacterized protein n=1 Tax=Typha angustifolia TaxID=59011 RepID=UPI003C2C56E3
MGKTSSLLQTTEALIRSDHLPSSSSSPSSTRWYLPALKLPFLWSGAEKRIIPSYKGKKGVAVSLEAAVVIPEKQKKPSLEEGNGVIDSWSSLVNKLASSPLGLFGTRICWTTAVEILVEKAIVGCQSFTLIAVAGSLVGSILCFVEGCFRVLQSFSNYFHILSQRSDQGEVITLLVEAIDMFLVGTALLTFGMGLYIMFAGSNEMRRKRGAQITESNFGSFNLKKLKEGVEMQSISQVKSKLGHAILLLLQAGILEKFQNVPLNNGLELACFAGAVFISSACVFLLSKLTMQ